MSGLWNWRTLRRQSGGGAASAMAFGPRSARRRTASAVVRPGGEAWVGIDDARAQLRASWKITPSV